MENELFTPKEVRHILKISYTTMLLMIQAGEIEAINISKSTKKRWRITQQALNKYINGRTY